MDAENDTLELRFDGTMADRAKFLKSVRDSVIGFTGEVMTLDALIHEIAKNIFDHAHGKGSLSIHRQGKSYTFHIRDDGQESYDFAACSTRSRLRGNDINFGLGLGLIVDIAPSLGIDLKIDTTHGFSYSGVYTLINSSS